MERRKRLDINPVFNHRKSIALVDTAEDLVDSLDNLSVCLKHIEEKYTKEPPNPSAKADKSTNEKVGSLYEKLMENLEVARDLTDTLKREKWRLSRREMSLDLRMGELEEYKSHLKRDMTDMNQTVESLSLRVVQLQSILAEAEELQEETEAAKKEIEIDLKQAQQKENDLKDENEKLKEEIKKLKAERKDTALRQRNQELSDKMEILVMENKSLKEIIREKDEASDLDSVSDTSSVKDGNCNCTKTPGDITPDTNSNIPKFRQTTQIAYV